MSSFTCLNCNYTNKYEPDSEFRRLWEVFDGIWYCRRCCDKYMIYIDIDGKTIEDVD